jgi:hypothetical protein
LGANGGSAAGFDGPDGVEVQRDDTAFDFAGDDRGRAAAATSGGFGLFSATGQTVDQADSKAGKKGRGCVREWET